MQGAFQWDAKLEEALNRTFGLRSFRPLQREVINCTMSGRHCLCLMPSGGQLCANVASFMHPTIQGACDQINAEVEVAPSTAYHASFVGGKSLCYQLPALLSSKPPGGGGSSTAITLVISPLLSLIQVRPVEHPPLGSLTLYVQRVCTVQQIEQQILVRSEMASRTRRWDWRRWGFRAPR